MRCGGNNTGKIGCNRRYKPRDYDINKCLFKHQIGKEDKMSKLQSITRPNGSTIQFAYLPKEELELVGWKKGDNLKVEAKEDTLIITRCEYEDN